MKGRNGEKYMKHKASVSGAHAEMQQQPNHLQSPDRYSQCCRGTAALCNIGDYVLLLTFGCVVS